MRKYILCGILGCLCFSAVAVSGCDDKPKQIMLNDNVMLMTDKLAKKIAIEKQVVDELPGGLLRVRTRFLNKTDDPLWIDIQVVWKDKDGMDLYKTNWAAFRLPAGLVEQHDVSSMRPVDGFEFRIRKPDKGKDD